MTVSAPQVFATVYTGPTGISYSDENGLNPSGNLDIYVNCTASSIDVNSRNITLGVNGSAHSCNGAGNSFWLQYNMPLSGTSPTLDDVPEGEYCIYENGEPNTVCTEGHFFVENGLINLTGTTRIISVVPANFSVVATTTATGGATTTIITGFVSGEDISSTTQLSVSYTNDACMSLSVSAIEAFEGQGCNYEFDYPISSTGYFSFGETNLLFNYLGNWSYRASINNADNSMCLFGACLFHDTVDVSVSSGYFTVGGLSPYDQLVNEIASTSQAVVFDLTGCNPFAGEYNLGRCITALFIPNASSTRVFLDSYAGEFLTRFPIGYVTDAFAIMSSTTASSLTIIDATLPFFGNPHIELDLTNSLDYILNSTTSSFTNESADSGETFWQTTSYYWKIIVYLGAFLYLLSRILGSHLIPKIKHRK